jgi:hypothetical protein
MKRNFLPLAAMLWLAATAAQAQDQTNSGGRLSEQEMFGSPAASTTPTPVKGKAKALSTPVAAEGPTASVDAKSVTEENLQIGGTLSSEVDYYLQHGVPLTKDTVSNPNILFLYLDSKLDQDNRVFARIRVFDDPTGVSGGTPSSTASFTNPYGFGTGTSDNLQVSLQELKISANIDHQIFFTIGRQKVKYGTAKFFNPTDFLNSQAFNFFLPTDERPGVDMVKAQLPSGTSNFYLAGLTGNPSSGNPAGGYAREELGYDSFAGILGAGEISLSGYLPKNQAGKAGFDISQAVGDLDVYFEGAFGQDTTGDWKDANSVGASWDIRYADRSTNIVTLQAEHFQAGNLAEYGVFSIYLDQPGDWSDITFIETNLFDLIDQSGLSRLDTVYQFTQQVSGRVYVSGEWGHLGGTFYPLGQVAQTGARMDVSF